MSSSHTKYALLQEKTRFGDSYTWLRLCVLVGICTTSTIAVFSIWDAIYRESLNIPPKLVDIPVSWFNRAELYSYYFHTNLSHTYIDYDLTREIEARNFNESQSVRQIENERIYPSKLGNFIYKSPKQDFDMKLVCYYSAPNSTDEIKNLYLRNIDPKLCTHLNVGIAGILENKLYIDEKLKVALYETKQLKVKNQNLKVLLWVGGADSKGFPQMVATHATRKIFIRSLKSALETYHLDGIDLDWEFPTAYRRERQHFSQLLHEIRREYQREHRTYLLSVAVAAPEGIVYFAYDIREINSYADYVNIMTYDYHFYSRSSPVTGLNAPLYSRHNEHSILATLNINYTVNYWQLHGLDKGKIVVGLPTYGHSFRLVNPFNHDIGSPAAHYGRVGSLGFTSYSEVCWFKQNNFYVRSVYDIETCSPYTYAGLEWISYDDENSVECKTRFIKSQGFGGVMIFSLNTDDYNSYCILTGRKTGNKVSTENSSFPLVRKIYSVLFDKSK